jgi:hypothetical protein
MLRKRSDERAHFWILRDDVGLHPGVDQRS